jgi:hypothetical protein
MFSLSQFFLLPSSSLLPPSSHPQVFLLDLLRINNFMFLLRLGNMPLITPSSSQNNYDEVIVLTVWNFGFRWWAASNVENYPAFRQHCSCHLQGECVVVGHFWKLYIGQAVGGPLTSLHTQYNATAMYTNNKVIIIFSFQHLELNSHSYCDYSDWLINEFKVDSSA